MGSEFDKPAVRLGKHFLLAKNQYPAGHKPVVDSPRNLTLQILLEIREGKIAAQNELKRKRTAIPGRNPALLAEFRNRRL